jgi:hypothetical protein
MFGREIWAQGEGRPRPPCHGLTVSDGEGLVWGGGEMRAGVGAERFFSEPRIFFVADDSGLSAIGSDTGRQNFMTIADAVRYRIKSLFSVIFPYASGLKFPQGR